jgi:predicted negative regulator of RcsB-dependent stress response
MVARLRLARVEAYRENYDTALAVLNVATPGQFAARIAEIKGDIHVALGQTDDARAAYIQALTGAGSDTLDRSYIQMKLNDLSTPRVSEVPTEGDA